MTSYRRLTTTSFFFLLFFFLKFCFPGGETQEQRMWREGVCRGAVITARPSPKLCQADPCPCLDQWLPELPHWLSYSFSRQPSNPCQVFSAFCFLFSSFFFYRWSAPNGSTVLACLASPRAHVKFLGSSSLTEGVALICAKGIDSFSVFATSRPHRLTSLADRNGGGVAETVTQHQ